MALDKGWLNTVADGLTNKTWDDYDLTIQTEIADYNRRLASTTGFAAVDWKLVKAMLWTESGGPKNPSWTGRVLQIGNPGDKGWTALQNKEGAYAVVAPADLATGVSSLKIQTPKDNIRAAILYLFLRMCRSAIQRVDDPVDKTVYTYVFTAQDKNFDGIAPRLGTISEVLIAMNPGMATRLRAGVKLQYVKAVKKRVITGWTAFSTTNIALNYNGGGDANYAAKLNHVLTLFPQLKR